MSDVAPAGESWRGMIERLRESGALDGDKEAVLYRFFGDKEAERKASLDQVAIDYAQRVEADGKEAANAWLRETGQRMGREDREDMNRMLAGIGVEVPHAG